MDDVSALTKGQKAKTIVLGKKRFRPERGSNSGPLDQYASG